MPGERGPPLAPITPSVASVTLTSSDSNHSSRKSAALCVKIFTRPTISRAAQSAQLPRQLQVVDEIADAARRKLRRRGEQQRLPPPARGAPDALRRPDTTSASRCENLAISASVLARSCHMKKWRPSGNAREERGILGVHVVAEALQLQLAHDAFLQQAGKIGGGRDAISRPDFLGDRAAAHQFAPFQHQHLAPGARQIRGRDQAVVAAADDDARRTGP